jgi:hypothetical protein
MPTPIPSYLTRSPLPALGMSSMVLGVIALILAFLPILGIPLSACGVILGIIGIFAAFTVPGTYLRWAVAGLLTSLLSLAVNLAIWWAPGVRGEVPSPRTPTPWQPGPGRPANPPPAHPR